MVAIVLKDSMIVDYDFTNIIITEKIMVEFNGAYLPLYDEEYYEDED